MPLHPEILAFLDSRTALGRPPLRETPVATARANAHADLAERPAGRPVAAVRDTTFPGPAGPVPVRVYRPEGSGPFPLVVYYHGGGFVICSLDTHDAVARALCAGANVVVVSVDYRMAPEHRFPAATDDALAAVRWAAEAAAELEIDPARILVAGDSAGGNLAAVTALRLRDEGGPALKGQLLIYPVTDHAEAGHGSYTEFAEGFGLTADDMRWFFETYVPEPATRLHPHVSPLRAPDLSGLPPAYVLLADYDVLRDEARAYAERLKAAGVPVTVAHHADLNHGCISQLEGSQAVAGAYEGMMAWLRALVGR